MDATLLDQIPRLKWIHRIDLGSGVTTPGLWPSSPLITAALDRIDFRGKKVLDVGCWDGLWTFEAERRGAREVVAIDCVSQRPLADQPTFDLARRILNSGAKYFPDVSVYDVKRLDVADFDVVLFCGVYYHLKDPLLALARLRQVMRAGALLLVEGVVLDGPQDSYARFYYHQQHAGDPSNWWVPTVPCLREWVECSCFAILHEMTNAVGAPAGPLAGLKRWVKRVLGRPTETPTRHLLLARAVSRPDARYLYPDEELAPFQRAG